MNLSCLYYVIHLQQSYCLLSWERPLGDECKDASSQSIMCISSVACSAIADCAGVTDVTALLCFFSRLLSVRPVCPKYTLLYVPQGIQKTTPAFYSEGLQSLSCTRDCLSVLRFGCPGGGVSCVWTRPNGGHIVV